MTAFNESKRLVETVLRLSPANPTEVTVYVNDSSLTRFANNEVHQNVAERDVSVSVRVGAGRRYGIASTNNVSEEGLRAAVEQAASIARMLPDHEEWLPLAGPQAQPEVNGYKVSTGEFGPMQRAAGVRVVCELARERGLSAAGAFRIDAGGLTIGNSQGLLAHHESTSSELMTVVMSDDSSGHSARLAQDVDEIDPEAVAREAVEKADRGRHPKAVEPGEYEVILEYHAVADMLDFLAFTGLGALPVQEGRSFMSGKLDQRVMGPNVTMWDDPLAASGLPRPFDYEGVPARRVEMIVDGVARSPVYDRRTAAKDETTSTGHGLPAGAVFGPMPRNMFLKPGKATTEELTRSVKRGLLVTRFWYTRVVHPLTVHMTGMTRDGTFLIEDGEVVGPVKNLRFTESYVGALNRVDLISKETRLVREFFAANRVPWLKISSWTFTGGTEY